MMTRSTHPTPLTAILNFAIIILLGFAVWFTGNPLALLGLGLLHQLPCFPEELELKAAQMGLSIRGDRSAGDGIEDAGDYQSSAIGFVPTK